MVLLSGLIRAPEIAFLHTISHSACAVLPAQDCLHFHLPLRHLGAIARTGMKGMDSDHFGLVSAIFEIFTGTEPFQELTEEESQNRFRVDLVSFYQWAESWRCYLEMLDREVQ
jgi:hypothetical protein